MHIRPPLLRHGCHGPAPVAISVAPIPAVLCPAPALEQPSLIRLENCQQKHDSQNPPVDHVQDGVDLVHLLVLLMALCPAASPSRHWARTRRHSGYPPVPLDHDQRFAPFLITSAAQIHIGQSIHHGSEPFVSDTLTRSNADIMTQPSTGCCKHMSITLRKLRNPLQSAGRR